MHVITCLWRGGAERALYNTLAGGLSERFDGAVVSLRGQGDFGPLIRELGVRVCGLEMRGGIATPGALMRLRQLVRELRPDVIQGWMYHGNLAASVAGRLGPGRPAVAWNIRQTLNDLKAEKAMTRQVIRANRFWSGRVDAVIYNSRASRAQHETFGFHGSRAEIISNGFDLKRLQPNAEAGAVVRRELGIPLDATVIGHVARFHPMKDHASFLRAAGRVARTNPVAWFLVVGRAVFPDNPALAGIVPTDVGERFVFTGERSDVHRLMQAMDVLATSSAWGEAFPNVLGEAMACGVPCVATDVGESAEIVGDTGIVVPPTDTGALAAGLGALLRESPDERRKRGHAARERVQTHYRLDCVVTRYADLYQRLSAR